MKLTILTRADDITHVVLSGRLDTLGAEEISESFSRATAFREQAAIVDMSQVDFLSSQGIRILLANSKRLQKTGHKLVLLSPQPLVESTLKTSRVDAVMPIAADLDEAIRIAKGLEAIPGQTRVVRAPGPAPTPADTFAVEGEIKLAIKNELSELKGLHLKSAEFLETHRVGGRAAYAVSLAIDELVTNVIQYAYVDDASHLIDLRLSIEGEQAILQITDDGRPFDPRTGPALDLHAEEREVGGLGLLLVLDMVDALKYRRVDEKNCVEVRVHLSANATPADQ
jgi:serine/threonine-protein kinase RsbW